MSHTNAHTALLFFSRSAQEEVSFKTFLKKGNKTANIRLGKALISNTRQLLKQSQLPLFTAPASSQQGKSFGERFANAIQKVFNKGYQRVIAVGNDCPWLTLEDIAYSDLQLSKGGNVLGPACDGGIFLLGIQQCQFDYKAFSELDWQTPYLYESIERYFHERQADVSTLATKGDIDNEGDLLSAIRNATSPLTLALKEIVDCHLNNFNDTYIDATFISRFHQSLGLRGPPNS